MKLSPHIFFRRYLENVVVCDTKLHRFYIMNFIAADILEVLKNGAKSCEDVTEKLAMHYDAPYEEIENASSSFIRELGLLGMLEEKQNVPHLSVNSSKNMSDENIEQEFIWQLGEKKILYSALIELTHRCNLSCKHCYIINAKTSNEPPEFTTQQVFNLLDDLYDNNVFRIIFTGGEVFVRPDFFEILKYAISKRFLVDIFSNGTMVSEKVAREIAALNIRSFQSSVYGGTATVHDKFTGCKGSFDATVRTLKQFSSLGIAVGVKSSFVEGNDMEYERIRALSMEIGASFQPSFSIFPAIDGNKDALAFRIKDAKVIGRMMKLMNRGVPNARQTHMSAHICSAGLTGLSIDSHGDVYACNTLRIKIGNIFDSSVKEIWSNSENLEMIRALRNYDRRQCMECAHFNMCNFCPGIALLETGNMLKPYAEACTIAEVYNNILGKEAQQNEKTVYSSTS